MIKSALGTSEEEEKESQKSGRRCGLCRLFASVGNRIKDYTKNKIHMR